MARSTHPNLRLLLAVTYKPAKGALPGANGKRAFEVTRVVGHLVERGR